MIEPLASSSPVGFKSSVMHPFPSARPDRFDPMLLYLYPATALAIITPIYLLFSGDGERQDTRRREHGSRRSKLARAVVLLVCELILAGFDAMESDMAASYCFVAICMPSIASLALSLDYFYQQPSPMLLRTYMITVCFADVARIWNYQLSANNWVVSLLSLCTALVNATLLLSETYVKSPGSITSISTDFLREKSEDELSNRSLLERLRGLLGFGFRTWTTVDDLPQLADELSVATLSRDFEPIWASTNKQSSLALLKAILRSLGWSLIDVVPPRLLHVSLQMYMNFLVRRVLVFVSEHGVGQDDTKDNIILTMSLTLSAMTVASVWHTYMRGRLNVTLNGLLRSRILRKNLAVPSSEAIASQATTHLNTSVDEILAAMPYFHDFWLAPLEILLGLYLFHNFEGVLTYFMFPPLFVSATMAYYIAQRNIRATSRWRAATDNRLNRTNEILPHLKSLRMLGLDQPIIDYLQAYRGVEISASKGHNVHLILTWLCTSVAVYVSKMAVFAGGIYWTSSMMPIDAARVFIGSYLVYIIVQPTYALIQRGPLMKATFSSLKRLQGYFLSLESNESRALRDQNHSTSEPSDAAVVFCNASIGPEDSDVPLIERVTSTVKKGTFVVVSGPVGSGKSLFLKAIAGAARVLHGSLEIVGDAKSVSYCGQTPWLPNQSIKDTIVGNHEYDHDWYITVITACQLKREIDRLPGHHNLRIGLGGRNLSSGQRQRLALARAIYSRAPILVLDDVFSVLDHPTLLAIISALFKERGLLAKMHTTVFLATRAAEFFRLTHHIFDLDAHHNVHVANGKLETGKVFSNKINRKELSHNRQEYSVGPGDQLAVPESPDQDANQPPHMVPHSPEIPNSHHFLFFKSVSPWIFSLFLLLNAAAATWEGMPDTFARYWADHAPKDPSYFGYYILIVSFHWPLISSVAGLFLFCIVPKCALDLHLRFLVAIMRTPLAVVTSMSQDADLSQLARLIAPVGFDMPWALNTTAYRTFLSCAYIALVVHGIPRFLYAVPLCLVFTASIALAFLRGARQINGLYERARASLNLALKEASSGLEHIRSMGLSEDYLAKGLQALDQLQSCLSAKAQLQVWLMLFLQLLTSFILLTITILAVYYPSSTLTAGGVGLAFCSTQLIWLVLQNLLNSASGFDNLISFISRLLSFIEKTPVPDTNPAEMPEKWGRSCEIVLDNINAAYRTPSTEYTALHGISLTIPAGKKVGIIGRTGSGKSSLILALLNELEYTGSIKIDNVELSNISRDLIHSVTTVIPQEFARIPGTVRDNVYPWDLQKNPDERSATDEQIIQVLQQVGLWPYIEQQGGLGILLAAVKLSGGEKRLLGIARGILHHQIAQTKLVLMDEATSELDKETETKVNAVMMEAFSGCTVLAVTHYSQILQDTQVLVEVRDGRLTVLRED